MAPVISVLTRPTGNHAALVSGAVRPAGFSLRFQQVPVLVQAFRRMVRELAYDVSELALTTYLCAREHGAPLTALPVFLVRGFQHGAIIHHPARGIRHPAELAGRRVGVQRGYTVTTGVWARGILRDEYGLDPASVTWVCTGDEHVASYRRPANVVAAPPGAGLTELLLRGEIDAAVGIGPEHPEIQPLLADPVAAGWAALRARGHYPINHLLVVRDDVLAAHPTLATSLTLAFTQAKDAYVRRLATHGPDPDDPAARTHHQVAQELAADPLPYGLERNRLVLTELLAHARDQRILTRTPNLADLFAPGTADLPG